MHTDQDAFTSIQCGSRFNSTFGVSKYISFWSGCMDPEALQTGFYRERR